MSSFDVRCTTAAPQISPIEDGQILEVAIPIVLPIGGGGTHLGTMRFMLDKENAMKFFSEGKQAAEAMPTPSNIEVASNLSEVEKAAQTIDAMKEGV